MGYFKHFLKQNDKNHCAYRQYTKRTKSVNEVMKLIRER